MNYTLLIHEAEMDEVGYWAEVAELPGCATSGETLDEILHNAQDAIETYIDAKRLLGEEVPPPPDLKVEIAVPR
jgi:predicted RNase H-like HicB family nuclease